MNFNPNPLFYEMVKIYLENKHLPDKVTICNEGSSRCFGPETKVITSLGPIKITDLKDKDMVRTYNEDHDKIEYKPINEVLSFDNKKPSYKITLKDGSVITATQDHEFYYEGAWYALKHIVSLWNERKNIYKRQKD